MNQDVVSVRRMGKINCPVATHVTPSTYHLTVPVLRSANRRDAWRPTKPGANPAATAKVDRRVSAVNFMVLLRGVGNPCVVADFVCSTSATTPQTQTIDRQIFFIPTFIST